MRRFFDPKTGKHSSMICCTRASNRPKPTVVQ
jgi:hypothetical protein